MIDCYFYHNKQAGKSRILNKKGVVSKAMVHRLHSNQPSPDPHPYGASWQPSNSWLFCFGVYEPNEAFQLNSHKNCNSAGKDNKNINATQIFYILICIFTIYFLHNWPRLVNHSLYGRNVYFTSLHGLFYVIDLDIITLITHLFFNHICKCA